MVGPLFVNCGRPDWAEDGRDWPNREASRFVTAAGLRWHVQEFASAAGSDAPTVLLLHGTGAATHSWRDLAPLLTRRFRIVACDLPGHGFTEAPPFRAMSLPWMAEAVGGLLHVLGARPDLAVGHSAGAAIALRMVLDGRIAPRAVVSLNGALLPFEGAAGRLFPPMAKLMFLNPLTPRVLAFGAGDRARVRRLLLGTGSTIDARGQALYERLLRRPGHLAGTLGMMAAWDLAPLARSLPRLELPVVLVAGEADRAVPPGQARRLAERLPLAEVVVLPRLGHLAHEEDPEAVAALIDRVAADAGLTEGD